MKIAQVSSNRIPPIGYGGAERLIFWLSKALKVLGHEIIVFAPGGKEECFANGFHFIQWSGEERDLKMLITKDMGIDIVHYHQQYNLDYLPDIPFVVTQHGNHRKRSKILANTIFISQSQARNHQAEYFIYNGIPLEEYPLQTTKNRRLLFMALVKWKSKNVNAAIDLALDSNTAIDICGGDIWSTGSVFKQWKLKVKTRNKQHLLNSAGVVAGQEKLNYLQNASLLFYAVNWQEPFALAPHEALSCGTPVLAGPNGALQEYIKNGFNGYVVKSYEEALDAVQAHMSLSEEDVKKFSINCRNSAFSIMDCARSYCEAYAEVLDKGTLYANPESLSYKRKENILIKK